MSWFDVGSLCTIGLSCSACWLRSQSGRNVVLSRYHFWAKPTHFLLSENNTFSNAHQSTQGHLSQVHCKRNASDLFDVTLPTHYWVMCIVHRKQINFFPLGWWRFCWLFARKTSNLFEKQYWFFNPSLIFWPLKIFKTFFTAIKVKEAYPDLPVFGSTYLKGKHTTQQ